MEAVRTPETSVYSNETTRRYIPEGSNLHTRRHENLKSHIIITCSKMTTFWDKAPCSLAEVDQRFRGEYCLHHQGDDGSITQKAIIFIVAALRT
jgi:hypothetical protein